MDYNRQLRQRGAVQKKRRAKETKCGSAINQILKFLDKFKTYVPMAKIKNGVGASHLVVFPPPKYF